MIVDAHTHFWFKGFMPMAFHRNTAEEWAKKEAGRKPEMVLAEDRCRSDRPRCADYIANMDKAGVDASIIMMTDFGTYWTGEEPDVPYEEQVVRFGEFQKQNPGRLYACAYVDPRRKNCVELAEKGRQRMRPERLRRIYNQGPADNERRGEAAGKGLRRPGHAGSVSTHVQGKVQT